MRIAKVSFKRDYVPTPEELMQINAAMVDPDIKVELDEEGKMPWWSKHMVFMDKMPTIPIEVERVVACDGPLGLDTNTAARVPQINQKVNVQVPGLGLLLLNEVKALPDLCTNDLNLYLKEGWRIVAVCPQPDQRRPDYVVGRVMEKSDD